jgi:hypothetical protein
MGADGYVVDAVVVSDVDEHVEIRIASRVE